MKSTNMIRLRILLLWAALFTFPLSINLSAQTIKISGTIINQSNSPVPGASVTVKNTNRFAITDEAGRFTIDASAGNVLIITMIGYQRKEVIVGQSSSLE